MEGISFDDTLEARMRVWERFGSTDLQDVIAEIRRMQYFMSKRIDFDGEMTVLEYYNSIDTGLIDGMMRDERF